MAAAKKRRRPPQPLDAYRRIRKPMPPPERVVEGDRRRAANRVARRETEEDLAEHEAPAGQRRSEDRHGNG